MTALPQDLRVWLRAYADEHGDDVLSLPRPVNADQDLTAVVDLLSAEGRWPVVTAPGLVGAGADVPVVTNLFASRERIARMLGVPLDRLHAEYAARSARPLPLAAASTSDHRVTEDVDLAALPLLRHFASDLGPYITSGVVLAVDPDTGVGNLSYHRATPAGARELALSLHSRGDLWRILAAYERRGERMPVAMVVGAHPLFMLAASARVPADVDERHVAGGLFGAPLEVVRTPRHGLEVPRSAEIVIEGCIDPAARAPEGPFGEFSGYSSDRSTHNVMTVEAVMTRPDPILVSVTGGRSAEHLTLARLPRESEMVDKLRARFPQVRRVHYPNSGTHFHAYVAIDQRRQGEARQIMLGLLGWDPYLKTVIAVDADIDVTDDAAVLWAMAVHVQPAQDVLIVDGLPGSPLDPSSSAEGTTSRMGIDATRARTFTGVPIVVSDDAAGRAADLLRDARAAAAGAER
ncbi:UbiD family decarboxylase [Microbacterium sp. SORGH_AS_0888]|uniref:UbiD family decarboxylase n=1 Tax=Microbacterium sp. SORGH_AS_0888 TaxID=3041791 RepID=UPI002781229D|nr:UbiD family decarboxylase [Microbacterium sp. SORGH_AS_0888]MDQ1129479.1 2,5-furandicarboxylate decarboxylase 1 [Microbacterium sp. SORGH_AS_0888]